MSTRPKTATKQPKRQQPKRSQQKQKQQQVAKSPAQPPQQKRLSAFDQPFETRNPPPEGKMTGALRLDLNLDVEVKVNARVHGDLTLALMM